MFGKSLQRRLHFEGLEQKRMLAITVDVVDGDLLITGDSGTNAVVMLHNEDPVANPTFQYQIEEYDVFWGNGPPVNTYLVSGVTRDVIVNLGGGDDSILIRGNPINSQDVLLPPNPNYVRELVVPRDLIVNGGDGIDEVYVAHIFAIIDGEKFNDIDEQYPVVVGRNLSIDGGQGDDFVFVSTATVNNDLSFSDSQGNNEYAVGLSFSRHIMFDTPTMPNVVHGDISVTMGSGGDLVDLIDLEVDGNVNVNLGGGNDSFQSLFGFTPDNSGAREQHIAGNLTVNLGSGTNDAVTSLLDVAGSVTVGGSGANVIDLNVMTIGSLLTVLTGGGDDVVLINQSTADAALIVTAGGSDFVSIAESAVDLLMVQLGAGSDTLELFDVDATLAILSGGGGSDTYNDYGGNDLLLELALSFEIVPDLGA